MHTYTQWKLYEAMDEFINLAVQPFPIIYAYQIIIAKYKHAHALLIITQQSWRAFKKDEIAHPWLPSSCSIFFLRSSWHWSRFMAFFYCFFCAAPAECKHPRVAIRAITSPAWDLECSRCSMHAGMLENLSVHGLEVRVSRKLDVCFCRHQSCLTCER